MKASKLVTAAAALALVIGVAAKASAQNRSDDDRYAYVMVTGSDIPQKVRIKPIGTTTFSPVRYYDRKEIDQTGRFTTEGVLRQDPSIQVHGFGQAGPSN